MTTFLALLWKFLCALAAGNFKNQWQEHKEKEALNAQNDVSAKSDAAVDEQLRTEFTRH